MYIKVINPHKKKKSVFKGFGSCTDLVNHISNEDEVKGLEREFYFSHDKDYVLTIDVIRSIDNNCPHIVKNEAKFYCLLVAPHPDEMQHIKKDKKALKEYVRDAMDIYAGNFNKKDGTSKNLTGKDLVYFAKLKEYRYYRGTEEEVKQGKVKQGDIKPGENTHVQIIVSRQDKSKKIKLSPLANSKKLFHRETFKLKCCLRFDETFNYNGAGKELKRHIVMRDGSVQQLEDFFRKEYALKKALREKMEAQMLEQPEKDPSEKQEIKQEQTERISTLWELLRSSEAPINEYSAPELEINIESTQGFFMNEKNNEC